MEVLIMERGTRRNKIYDEPTKSSIKEETNEIVEKSPAEVETTVPPTAKNGIVVNCLNVNVRKWPSFESQVLEILSKGDVVKITGKRKGFYKVSTNKTSVGYISSDFIKEE